MTARQVADVIATEIEKLRDDKENPEAQPIAIPLAVFLCRMTKMIKVEKCVFIAALDYLRRIAKVHYISNENKYRVTLVAVMLASKFLQDVPFTNKYWAENSGLMSLRDLNTMEREALCVLDYKLNVDDDFFDSILEQIMTQA